MPRLGEAILTQHTMTAALPQVFGKYTLISHLATGGMAEVYFARQCGPSGFERELVIKRILPHLAADPNFVQMFLAEATLAARVNHPNIAHIYELGDHAGDYFMAMEYVPGVTLEKILELVKDRGGTGLPWPIAARIVASVAEGLDHAHKARDGEGRPLHLVHRDVSPTNIMVSWDGVIKLLDFGVAKSEVQSDLVGARVRTGAGVLKGKLPYMSPEQLQGLELDARSDVFSLGAVLYELVCGQRPFPGEAMAQLTVQIMSREPISPEVFAPSFPPDLKPIIWKALSKSVTERYQTARDLKQDLEQFLADEHVSCSNYDMEAYLRELIPDRASFNPVVPRAESPPSAQSPLTNQSLVPAALPAEQREVSMSTPQTPDSRVGKDEPSGRLAPLDPHGLDLDAEERRQQRGKGNSSVVTIVISVLVFLTAAVFYILHARAVDRSQTPAIRPSDATIGPSTPPGPATNATTAVTPPPAGPPAVTAPGTPGTPPATAVPPAGKNPKEGKDAKEPKAGKEAAKDDKEAAKPGDEPKHEKHKPHHKSEDSGEAPHALPRLPLPPPTE